MEFVKTYDEVVHVYAVNICTDFYEAEKTNDIEKMIEISDSINVDIEDLQKVSDYLNLIIEYPDIKELCDAYFKLMDAIEEKAYNA